MSNDTLSITDNRTGSTYEIPIENDTIKATDLRQIKVNDNDFGMMSYDPAFGNTASCKSKVTFIDGEKGILRYRGYPIEQLAEKSTFLEVSSLLLNGELPTKKELTDFSHDITHHTYLHENIKKLIDSFRYNAHPMGMLMGTVAALSTFYPEAKDVFDKEKNELHILRLIAKMPTIAGFSYRHIMGLPYIYPDNELSYAGNFLNMMFKMAETKYVPNKAIEKAIDVLFILHADHEQNCSASAMRSVGSSLPDPYSATSAAIGALYGPLHGGANEAVLEMLKVIGTKDKIPEYIERAKKGEFRLMGFGHRIYKAYDPRAKIIKDAAHEVLSEHGTTDQYVYCAICNRKDTWLAGSVERDAGRP
jgi:citrate synthase